MLGVILAQRPRRWAKVTPTLGERLVLAGEFNHRYSTFSSFQHWRREGFSYLTWQNHSHRIATRMSRRPSWNFHVPKKQNVSSPHEGRVSMQRRLFPSKKEHFKNTNSHINPQTDFFSGRPILPLIYFLISNKERLKMYLHFKYLIRLLDRLL